MRNLRQRICGAFAATVALAIAVGLDCRGDQVTSPSADTAPLGHQVDGSFLVSSGQRLESGGIAFPGRPSDFAIHPTDDQFAVLAQNEVFLCTSHGVLARSHSPLGLTAKGDAVGAGFHGIVWTSDSSGVNWTPDGLRFIASTDQGYLQEVLYEDWNCVLKKKIALNAPGDARNAVPGGMCLTKDGQTLYVAAAGLDQVVEVNLKTLTRERAFPVQALPYEVRLSQDEQSLIVTNWGGRLPQPGDRTAKSADENIIVDERGAPASGSISIIDRKTGRTTHVDVGIHPTAIAFSETDPHLAYVANAMSDSISEVNINEHRVTRTIPIRWGDLRVVGAMPNALAINGQTLYACNGGDNAIAEIDLVAGAVRGFRHAGYFPCAIQLSHDRSTAYVLNSKGNGSVENTIRGNPGSPHDFQGTVTVVDLGGDLAQETDIVAKNNHWESVADPRPDHPVYRGAIKHVLYIIKENQTYDSIFGDMPVGNGDPKLCIMGESVMPNHRKIARDFTLFDNSYVSGTNSADGHAWSTQSIANDYLEHFYVGYSRTYPDDGDCAMSISTGGCLWDVAAAKGKKIRVYGEFCDDALAEYLPRKPKDWFEAWDDYKSGEHKFTFVAHSRVAGLKPYICPSVHYWPLIQSDQSRADEFVREYEQFSKADTVPDLMILSLPSDHGEGLNPEYPTIRSMQADNDLAFGRVVETISHSPQWAETIIFCIEDDGQASPDHVDGHRVPFFVISPYTKRGNLDSHRYTTTSVIRSIELILGLDPMTRFDALAAPVTTCFNSTPDLTPYEHTPNNVPLGERQAAKHAQTEDYRNWEQVSAALNWNKIDGADPYWYSRVQWFAYTEGKHPFPKTPGQPAGPADQRGNEDDD
jgi:DNA-binding beta-propeller fold protein YncE